MSDVEEVEGSRHVHYLVPRLGLPAVGELQDLLRGGQELGHARPGGARVGVGGQLHGRLARNVLNRTETVNGEKLQTGTREE